VEVAREVVVEGAGPGITPESEVLEDRPVRHVWHRSDRVIPRRVVRPTLRLLQLETAGGAVLLIAAVAALIWENSPWHESYERLWATDVGIRIGDLDLPHLGELTLQLLVNDGLMALFFFVVAMEIKREVVAGDLSDRKTAALPVLAAVGGMVVPAGIYALFTIGTDASGGWGIPMATDIAFAVGILALAGPRVPTGARLFLLTLAIADDLGAIVVIAIFYTSDLSFAWLLAAVGCLGAVAWVTRLDVRAFGPYLVLGALAWLCLLESGIHATLAGVAMGFLTPAWSFHDPQDFAARARPLVDEVDVNFRDDVLTAGETEQNDTALAELVHLANESRSPLSRMSALLGPWTAFAIVPLFAFANAGVRIPGADALASPVVFGVAVGLVVGKTVGVFGATWLGLRLRLGQLPPGVTMSDMLGVALCAGVGFTVALFVSALSFPDAPLRADEARLGILVGSLVAGVLAITYLRLRKAPRAVA
jgi:Na+:H+ antiporter, NhaA family